MTKLNTPVYPDQEGVSLAAEGGVDKLMFLSGRQNSMDQFILIKRVLTTQHGKDILMFSSGRQNSTHRSILTKRVLTEQHGKDILMFSSG